MTPTLTFVSAETPVCDVCHEEQAVMHFFITNTNVCGHAQCERIAKQKAAEKELAARR